MINWTDKKNGVDVVLAEDINSIAHAVNDEEAERIRQDNANVAQLEEKINQKVDEQTYESSMGNVHRRIDDLSDKKVDEENGVLHGNATVYGNLLVDSAPGTVKLQDGDVVGTVVTRDGSTVHTLSEKASTAYVDSAKADLVTELDARQQVSEKVTDISPYTEDTADDGHYPTARAVNVAIGKAKETCAPLDENGKIPDEYLYGSTVKEYGVRWKGTSSTDCERLGDAVGLEANAHLGVLDSVKNDFDNIYPWSEMRLCNLDAEGNILAYANEPTFKRDGTNGDVMVQIPKFYYKREKTAEGYEEWWICAVKLPGYELHPVFMDDGKEVSAVFHSAYNSSTETVDGGATQILRSISGVQPTVRETRKTFRARARNKGTGWSIEDISCINALQMLYMVEYASTDSQEKLGKGASSLNYTSIHIAVEEGENTNDFVTATVTANKYRVGDRIEIGTIQGQNDKTPTPRTITAITARKDDADISAITFDGDPVASIEVGNSVWNVSPLNGSCDELGGESGYIGENGKDDSAYRGIEGIHGKLFRFIDGVNIKDHLVHYANSITDYADGVYDGKCRAVGYTNGATNGYVSGFGYDEKAPWVMFPTSADGSSATYVPDYYYRSTAERQFTLGGYFNGGTGNGMFNFYCNYPFSHSHVNFGAHLIIKKP